jgi:tyrosine-protein phosphatase YwqE
MLSQISGLFKKNKTPPIQLLADMHSHLIPGIDDGAPTMEDSMAMIKFFVKLGYRKIITTPHIMGDFYKNSAENILPGRDEVRKEIQKAGLNIEFDAAAEYYLDEFFMADLEADKPLLTFGKNYVLFELSFLNEPIQLKEAIFKMRSQGYSPILAHPERYQFYYGKIDKLKELRDNGVLLQINLNSLSGYYSKGAKKMAQTLIKDGYVDFVGSDCHHLKHLENLEKVLQQLPVTMQDLPLKNNTLIDA